MADEPTVIDGETLEETPLGEGLLCPECGVRLKNPVALGIHRAKEHGVAGRAKQARERRETRRETPRTTAPRAGSKGAEINRLRRQLKQNVKALTLLPFMAKGTAQNLNNPAVTQVIDEKADAFADAWVAVAEQNEWVRRNLALMMSGGIMLNAAAQTAALGYVVAVFSGFAPLHPGAAMLLPEMQQFMFVPQTPSAETATNGKVAGDAESA